MLKQDKLRGAIVGFGFISSKGHLPSYKKRSANERDVDIVAICDVCPERLREVPQNIRIYSDYKELINKEKNNIDFIDVSTHVADHYKIAKMGLENGLHVLCEKPITAIISDAENLIKTAMLNKRVLFPCHNYKHAPVINAIREIVHSKQIGEVNAITLNTFRNTHAVGTKEWNPHWRRYKELSGGGIAMDHGSHSLYLTFEWLRGYPKSVSATSKNYSFPKYDTEDNFSAVYDFENGVANVHLTWTAGIRKVLYTIQGDKGAITIDDDRMQVSIINKKENELNSHKASWQNYEYNISSDWMDSSHTSWFNSMFDNFKIAIQENDFANKEIIDAYFCVHSIVKAYESINNNSTKINLMNRFALT